MPRIDPDEGPDPQIDGDLLGETRGDGEPETEVLIECPVCRERISYVAERCPYCGHWVTQEDRDRGSRRRNRVWTAIVVAIVALLVFAMLV